MSINQIQTKITAKVWQAIAHSNIDTSGIARDDLNTLVEIVVDAALEEVDAQFEQINRTIETKPAAENDAPLTGSDDNDDDEVILWEGRPLLSLTVHYAITNERIRMTEGLLGKEYNDVELVRIKEFDFKQTMTERTLNIGDVHITSHDSKHPKVTLRNVKAPKEVHEILRRAVLKSREKYSLSYREEM